MSFRSSGSTCISAPPAPSSGSLVPPCRRGPGRCEGNVALVVALSLPVLVLFLVMVIDVGLGYVGRAQLQSVADSAARGALVESTRTGRSGGAGLAQRLARETSVVDGGVELGTDTDVEWGTYDFGSGQFAVSTSRLAPPPQAVRVTARRSQESPSGALGGLFGPIQVEAGAVASYRCRDVVIAQDTSNSFQQEIDRAKQGLRGVADALAQSPPGATRVGLVSFRASATVELGLLPIPDQAQALTRAIQSLEACESFALCAGTSHGHALHLATQMLLNDPSPCDADRLILLVSDGVPCGPDGTTLQAPDPRVEPFGRIEGALDRAALARAEGISIAPILLAVPGGVGCTTPQGIVATDPVFNAQLAAGFGMAAVTSRPDQLPDVVLRALGGFPVVLVH